MGFAAHFPESLIRYEHFVVWQGFPTPPSTPSKTNASLAFNALKGHPQALD